MARRAAPLVALALLAACAPTRPIVLDPPPGAPAGADGRYRGTARLVRGNQFCPRSGPRTYEVQGGAVSLAYSAGGRTRVPLTAQILSDGTFNTTDGAGVLNGQLSNGTLEISITSQQCEHRWTMRHVP